MPRGVPADLAGTHITRAGRLRPWIRVAIREHIIQHVTGHVDGWTARGLRIELSPDDGSTSIDGARWEPVDEFKPREDFSRLYLRVRASEQRGMYRAGSMEMIALGRIILDGEQVTFGADDR